MKEAEFVEWTQVNTCSPLNELSKIYDSSAGNLASLGIKRGKIKKIVRLRTGNVKFRGDAQLRFFSHLHRRKYTLIATFHKRNLGGHSYVADPGAEMILSKFQKPEEY